jgi:16S rRNA (uracil1498-N3)-methyltransferase
MSRRRFHLPPECIHDGIAELPPDQAHHLRNVLRLRKDDEVEVFDGMGGTFLGRVDFAGHGVRVVELKPLAHPNPAPPLLLAAAIIKPARFEWMLEKATELGVDEFIPLITKYSEFRITNANLEARLERWQRIVTEACRQCGRALVPNIRSPISFADFLALEHLCRFTPLLCCEGGGTPLRSVARAGAIALCVGPEGGWDSGEVDAAVQAGFKPVSLGRSTLRAETAAIAAIALITISDCGLRIAD